MSLAEAQPSPKATRRRLPNRTKVVYTLEGIGVAFLIFMAALRIDDRFALGLAAYAAMMGFRFGAWLVQRREQKLGKDSNKTAVLLTLGEYACMLAMLIIYGHLAFGTLPDHIG